jgi:hypothetical protein
MGHGHDHAAGDAAGSTRAAASYGNIDPSLGGRISVTTDRDLLLEESFGGETTYWYQLRAFCDAVAGGPPLPTQGEGAVANMVLIDAVRAAAAISL